MHEGGEQLIRTQEELWEKPEHVWTLLRQDERTGGILRLHMNDDLHNNAKVGDEHATSN